MLTPNYLWSVADRLVEIYEELNTFAVNDICRRLISADWQMTETARYQLINLMQSGMLLQDIQEQIAEITKRSQSEVAQLFKRSAIQSMKYSDALYTKAGYNILPFTSSEKMLNILTATYLQTNGTLENFTQSIATATQTEFYRQVDKAYMQIMSGQSDYNSAIMRAIDAVSKQGIRIDYPSGATISVEAGVRRAVVTGINQASCRLEMERMKDFDTDLVIVSQHYGARPSHAEWQGKVYSVSGNSEKYPNFYTATGYGTGEGLGGWNCRHSFSPFFEGLSQIPQQFDVAKNNEIYSRQQEQRRLERGIRTTKRQISCLEASIESTTDATVKEALQKRLNTAKSRLSSQSKYYKQYCYSNHLKTQNDRLRIAKSSPNGLTSKQNSGNIKDIETGGKITENNAHRFDIFEKQATKYYEQQISNDDDVKNISQNTSFKEEEILQIKNHLMREEHLFANGETRKFDVDIDIALAWQRLIKGENILESDIILLYHELTELSYMKQHNCSYEDAHAYAVQFYDWDKAVSQFTDTDNLEF